MFILSWIEKMKKMPQVMKRIFYLYLALIVMFDVFIPREHAHYFVDKIYAFWTFFALVGCFLLIKISKGVAHIILAKDEDYYG